MLSSGGHDSREGANSMASEGGAADELELELRLIGADEDDPERVAELTYQLRRELLDLDVEAVRVQSSGPVPSGTKGAEALAIGQLIVQISATVLPALLTTMQSWVSRLGSQKIRIKVGDDEIELSGPMSSAERRALIKAFADRRASG
jgi:hypothetical protein